MGIIVNIDFVLHIYINFNINTVSNYIIEIENFVDNEFQLFSYLSVQFSYERSPQY